MDVAMKTKKYIFNQIITFNVDMGNLSISGMSEHDAIPIANPAQRLLLLLIANQGQVVSREDIFKKVWDDHGLISSNNNLNQCVSRLRKVIRTLGIEDEFIVTVPKIGFMLEPEIQVDICDIRESESPEALKIPNPPQPLAANEPAQPPISRTRQAPQPANTRRIRSAVPRQYVLTATICAATAFIGWLLFLVLIPSPTSAHKELFLGNIDSCKVFLSNSSPSEEPNSQLKHDLLQLTSSYSMSCKGNEFLLLRQERYPGTLINGITRFQLNKCTTLQGYKAEICSNHIAGLNTNGDLNIIHPTSKWQFAEEKWLMAHTGSDDEFSL